MAFKWVVYGHVFIINENKARFRIKKHIDIVLFVSILIFKAEDCWLSILKRISLLSFQFIYAFSSKKRTQSLAHLVSSTHSVLCTCLACYSLTSDFSVMHFSCSVSAFHTRKKKSSWVTPTANSKLAPVNTIIFLLSLVDRIKF